METICEMYSPKSRLRAQSAERDDELAPNSIMNE